MHSRSNGFTLIETLIAVSLISITFGAFVTIVTKSFQSNVATQQSFVAVSLAQEGIELVRNKRDNNVLHVRQAGSGEWRANLLSGGMGSVTYQPDASDDDYLTWGNSFEVAGSPLKYMCRVTNLGNDAGKFFNCGGPANERVPGNYVRTVSVSPVPGDSNAIRVDSKVVWNANSTGITLSTILYKVF